MTNKKIETKQEMVELLTSYGWNKSGMFNENMMSQDGQMDAYDFGEYATIEAPNMKIRLQKNGATVQVKR